MTNPYDKDDNQWFIFNQLQHLTKKVDRLVTEDILRLYGVRSVCKFLNVDYFGRSDKEYMRLLEDRRKIMHKPVVRVLKIVQGLVRPYYHTVVLDDETTKNLSGVNFASQSTWSFPDHVIIYYRKTNQFHVKYGDGSEEVFRSSQQTYLKEN